MIQSQPNSIKMMTAAKTIIWLASWYPNRWDRYTGDFIQRHARAAAIYNKVIVIHVAHVPAGFSKSKVSIEINTEGNLTEHIIYLQSTLISPVTDKALSACRHLLLLRKAVLSYHPEQDGTLVHVHVPLNAGLIALWLKRKYKKQYAVTEHYGIYNDVVEDSFDKRSFLFRYLTKKVFAESLKLISVSEYLGNAINQRVIKKPFVVIPNCVDTSAFHQLSQDSGGDIFRFIHVSGMESVKNVEGIVRAMIKLCAKRKDVELILVGRISRAVYKLAVEHRLYNQKIFFTGEIEYSQVATQMQKAHSLIVFSIIENLPCVVLEALCCGLPIIASRVGGIPEIVNSDNGILVDPNHEDQLIDAMNEMIVQFKRFNRKLIGEKAQSAFCFERIGAQFTQIYQKMASQ